MKRVIGYILLVLFLFLLLRFIGGVIFSRPSKVKQLHPQPTPTPEVNEGGQENKGFVATLEVVVFNDRDDNKIRGFGEEGLDWQVHYKVGESQEVKTVTTHSNRKCFPTIFNWLYGGCSSPITLEPGQWLKIWPERKKGWKNTTPPQEIELKTGKNLVMFGVRRYRPEEKEEEKVSFPKCEKVEVTNLGGGKQKVKILAKSPTTDYSYRLVVDGKDYGWQKENIFELHLSGKSHLLKGYVKDGQGNVNGGEGECSLKVGLNMKVQPKTGTSTWLLIFSLFVSPIMAVLLYRYGREDKR